MCGEAGHWRAVAPAPPQARVSWAGSEGWAGWRASPVGALPALALLIPSLVVTRPGWPLAGPQLALLGLAAGALVAPQFLPLANLDRVRRGRPPLMDWFPPLRPVSWYRFVTVVALGVFLAVLALAFVGFQLPSGVVGPRYPETVVFEAGFRAIQVVVDAVAIGWTGLVALHALNVCRWAARGSLVPARRPPGPPA
jgi:hypothetical protein